MTVSPSSIQGLSYPHLEVVRELHQSSSEGNLHLVSPQGQIEVHTSPHRGSFSVVFSEALRSAGLGSSVVIAQFLKGGVSQGPNKGINLCGRLNWLRPNFEFCLDQKQQAKDLPNEIQNSVVEIWELCKKLLKENKVHKLVLDEIGLAIKMGLIQEKNLVETLEERPESIDVILTGPSIPLKVMSMADQVTQLRCCR